jgi:hypothetical protein
VIDLKQKSLTGDRTMIKVASVFAHHFFGRPAPFCLDGASAGGSASGDYLHSLLLFTVLFTLVVLVVKPGS